MLGNSRRGALDDSIEFHVNSSCCRLGNLAKTLRNLYSVVSAVVVSAHEECTYEPSQLASNLAALKLRNPNYLAGVFVLRDLRMRSKPLVEATVRCGE